MKEREKEKGREKKKRRVKRGKCKDVHGFESR